MEGEKYFAPRRLKPPLPGKRPGVPPDNDLLRERLFISLWVLLGEKTMLLSGRCILFLDAAGYASGCAGAHSMLPWCMLGGYTQGGMLGETLAEKP